MTITLLDRHDASVLRDWTLGDVTTALLGAAGVLVLVSRVELLVVVLALVLVVLLEVRKR